MPFFLLLNPSRGYSYQVAALAEEEARLSALAARGEGGCGLTLPVTPYTLRVPLFFFLFCTSFIFFFFNPKSTLTLTQLSGCGPGRGRGAALCTSGPRRGGDGDRGGGSG